MSRGPASRPDIVAFDVVGTLFSLDPVAERLKEAGLPQGALDEWFARFLRDTFALDTTGRYAPYAVGVAPWRLHRLYYRCDPSKRTGQVAVGPTSHDVGSA